MWGRGGRMEWEKGGQTLGLISDKWCEGEVSEEQGMGGKGAYGEVCGKQNKQKQINI